MPESFKLWVLHLLEEPKFNDTTTRKAKKWAWPAALLKGCFTQSCFKQSCYHTILGLVDDALDHIGLSLRIGFGFFQQCCLKHCWYTKIAFHGHFSSKIRGSFWGGSHTTAMSWIYYKVAKCGLSMLWVNIIYVRLLFKTTSSQVEPTSTIFAGSLWHTLTMKGQRCLRVHVPTCMNIWLLVRQSSKRSEDRLRCMPPTTREAVSLWHGLFFACKYFGVNCRLIPLDVFAFQGCRILFRSQQGLSWESIVTLDCRIGKVTAKWRKGCRWQWVKSHSCSGWKKFLSYFMVTLGRT